MVKELKPSRTWATFRVWGAHLDPDEITTALAINPSEVFRKGDKRGTNGIWRHGYWSITSHDRITSLNLEEHIRWLLDQLEPVQSVLLMLLERRVVKADIFCFYESMSDNTGIVVTPSLLGRLASLNLALGIDIYFDRPTEANQEV